MKRKAKTLAQELKGFRKRHGMTYEALGTLAPVAMMTLYRIETGKVDKPMPSTATVMRQFMAKYDAKHRARRAS